MGGSKANSFERVSHLAEEQCILVLVPRALLDTSYPLKVVLLMHSFVDCFDTQSTEGNRQ